MGEVDAMPEVDERALDALRRARALNPEEQALRRELRAVLESSVEAIPEIYRSVFMLREVEAARARPPSAWV